MLPAHRQKEPAKKTANPECESVAESAVSATLSHSGFAVFFAGSFCLWAGNIFYEEKHGNSKSGGCGVWADGFGDRASGGCGGIRNRCARSERGVGGQGDQEHREESESAGGEGHDHRSGAG